MSYVFGDEVPFRNKPLARKLAAPSTTAIASSQSPALSCSHCLLIRGVLKCHLETLLDWHLKRGPLNRTFCALVFALLFNTAWSGYAKLNGAGLPCKNILTARTRINSAILLPTVIMTLIHPLALRAAANIQQTLCNAAVFNSAVKHFCDLPSSLFSLLAALVLSHSRDIHSITGDCEVIRDFDLRFNCLEDKTVKIKK